MQMCIEPVRTRARECGAAEQLTRQLILTCGPGSRLRCSLTELSGSCQPATATADDAAGGLC